VLLTANNGAVPILSCDLDDTLVNRGRVLESWAAEFAELHGLGDDPAWPAWVADLDDGGMTTREDFWAAIKGRLGLAQPVDDLVASWRVDFPSRYRCEQTVLDELTEARTRGWSLGVVTNGDADGQARKLAAAGLDTAVDSICISGAEGVRKPDPRIFALAAERAGAPLRPGWMIGDHAEADIAGARAVGLGTVWLSRGRTWPIADLEPDHQAVDPAAAIRWVLEAEPIPT
jgi:putative hydrolase of the HAD superfamily